MAFSVEEIKKGLSDPEIIVREHCLRYFADSWSTDSTVMPLVVASVREHDWRTAFYVHQHLARLPQTPETLSWFIDELERTERSFKHPNFRYCLWKIVAAADVGLLRPH